MARHERRHSLPGGPAALVLSGGGARGAYQVGVLKALAEAMPGPLPFSILTGVSVGAINAVALAERADDFLGGALKLERLWRSLRCSEVFETGAAKMGRRFLGWAGGLALPFASLRAPRSLLDAAPLEELLGRAIDYDRIGAMVREGHLQALAVTASSYATGFSTTFYQPGSHLRGWARSRRRGREEPIGTHHVLASAALPGVFEARRIGPEWYGDGALRQTAPLSPAIHLGAERLVLIAARDGVPDEEPDPSAPQDYPAPGVIGGQLLDIVFNDNLDADLERLNRINQTLAAMQPGRRAMTDLRPLDTLMIRPSEDIRPLAALGLKEAPWTVRILLSALGADKPPYLLPSYLTFEPGYISALIDLGYRDGRASLSGFESFLSEPRQATG